MPWIRLAPLVGLWLTRWLFQGGFVGSSSGFVVPQKGFIGPTPELGPLLEETRDNAPTRQVNLPTRPA